MVIAIAMVCLTSAEPLQILIAGPLEFKLNLLFLSDDITLCSFQRMNR